MSDMRDEYGNPVRQTAEYGNPVGQTHGGTMGSYGIQGTGTDGRVGGGHGAAHAGGGHMQEHRVGGGGQTGILHRSGSSSSSSSEDDEQGGRRKKGMKQKIKEKIPGVGGKETDPHHACAMGQQTGTYGQIHEQEYYGEDQGCEKKGIMEKIKQKMPGVGGNEQDPHHTSTTLGNQPMGQQTAYGQQHQGEYCGQEQHEKKGIMDKIKEKLPGGGHSREA